jgi:hypothetical protein
LYHGLTSAEATMKIKNPIVVTILVGLAIIVGVAAYTFLKPEPEPAVHSATYGYYHQESRVGGLQFTLAGTGTYQFKGDFSINTTVGEVGGNFDGNAEYVRGSTLASTSLSQSHKDSSLPFPTAIDAGIFVDLTTDTTFLLLPQRWGAIHAGYSTRFTPSIACGAPAELNVEMTVIGTEDVVVPYGTYEHCFLVNGTQPDVDLEMTLWVTEQGIVPQAQITMAVRGLDHLRLTMQLERYE